MFGAPLFSAVHDAAASTLERMIKLFEDPARKPEFPSERAAVSWACNVTRFVLAERARDERKYLPYGDLSQAAGPEANPEPREDLAAERLRRTLDRIGGELDAQELCQRASLTEGQRVAICRRLNGASLMEIGLELGSPPASARQRAWALIERGLGRLQRTAKTIRG
jgi:hypothetical protein